MSALVLSRELVERLKSALDVGQSIIDDAPHAAEQDELRGLLVELLRRPEDAAVVLAGNPVDGLAVYGPFACAPDAVDWGAANLPGTTWWVADVGQAD